MAGGPGAREEVKDDVIRATSHPLACSEQDSDGFGVSNIGLPEHIVFHKFCLCLLGCGLLPT